MAAAAWTPERGWHDVDEDTRQEMQAETVERLTGREKHRYLDLWDHEDGEAFTNCILTHAQVQAKIARGESPERYRRLHHMTARSL